MQARILIVDDERLVRWSLEQGLQGNGYEITAVGSGEDCLSLFREDPHDLVLLDKKLPGISGMTVLQEIKKLDPHVPVIMMTAHGDIETAVQAMKLMAHDYVRKPFNIDEVRLEVEQALETTRMRRELNGIKKVRRDRYGGHTIIGVSEATRRVVQLVEKVAVSDTSTVMLQGPSGAGKDLVAKAIHYRSDRADGPLMEVNCTSIPDTLFESELFGHEKGAFTDAKSVKKGLVELADRGTLYLDEIGDMGTAAQAKLLRVIEERSFKRVGGVRDMQVDVRFIAATNRDLELAVAEGSFRQDLYFRLNVIPIHLPPLVERLEDVAPLVEHFINRFNARFRKTVKGVTREALSLLESYSWPGNVRELRNVIERVMILETTDEIRPEHLPQEIVEGQDIGCEERQFLLPPGGVCLDSVEETLVRQAIGRSNGNQTRAAELLGISRDALRYRLKKYDLL